MHRPIAAGVVAALQEIFINGRPADKVIEFTFKANRKWGSRDRRQFAETVYDLVRWWRRYLWLAGIDWPFNDLSPDMEEPDFWRVLGAYGKVKELKIDGVPELQLRAGIDKQKRAVRMSLPDWLDEWAAKQTTDWDRLLDVLNEVAPAFLRANRLKTTAAQLLPKLQKREIQLQRCADMDDALKLNERANVFVTPEFQEGLFEMQDLHSQHVIPFLQPKPGERVIDACAGAGGKTLHLAAVMENKGKIIAMDVHERKLEELKKRVRRAGAHLVEMRLIDSTKVIKRLEGSADRILLDVPCTGLGVLRRNPDSKWKLSLARIGELQKIQDDILESYAKMLKKGGVMVYSTCSIARSENQEAVARFLARNQAFRLEKELLLEPTSGGGDGFYAARLVSAP
jgi:16S rRNA (cytosine967-C5)-methyltransferase